MDNKINNTMPLFSIGVFANLLGVHQRTLRIYDAEGILTPCRNENNRRMYSYNDLEKAKLICYLLKNLALNLAGIKLVLEITNKHNINYEQIKTMAQKIGYNEIENIEKLQKRGRPTKSK